MENCLRIRLQLSQKSRLCSVWTVLVQSLLVPHIGWTLRGFSRLETQPPSHPRLPPQMTFQNQHFQRWGASGWLPPLAGVRGDLQRSQSQKLLMTASMILELMFCPLMIWYWLRERTQTWNRERKVLEGKRCQAEALHPRHPLDWKNRGRPSIRALYFRARPLWLLMRSVSPPRSQSIWLTAPLQLPSLTACPACSLWRLSLHSPPAPLTLRILSHPLGPWPQRHPSAGHRTLCHSFLPGGGQIHLPDNPYRGQSGAKVLVEL